MVEWERASFDSAVSDIFGYHSLQLGFPSMQTLRENRMPQRWLAVDNKDAIWAHELPENKMRDAVINGKQVKPDLVCDFAALPFPAASLDLLVLPHTLDFCVDPRATLREVERVLMPEGRLVLSCFNPFSLWGVAQKWGRLSQHFSYLPQPYLPAIQESIAFWRLRDWLQLLGFEVQPLQLGCYRPALRSERWLNRYAWMDKAGARCWPFAGSVYFLVATKHVRGMHVVGSSWQKNTKTRAAVPVTPCQTPKHSDDSAL